TTTVAVALCDLISGRVIASKTDYNGQIPCGLDVISRINYARKPVQLEELRQRVIGTINDITASICDDPSSITVVSIAGNTTMIHLLLGIPPENIRLHPYIPAVYEAPVYTAGEIGLNVNAHAPVWIAPASGSYVGGDITAGALCTTLVADSPEPVLFIDIGTNGEILLGNNEFLLGCACSAGPAFEGGGIKHGMRAGAGAIERISIVGSDITVHTIGGEPPLGICGSGMISLAAELLKAGIIDPAGRYNQLAIDNEQLTIAEGITVSEADLQNLIRAKAAVYSACAVMLDSVGLQWGDVARVYIAGGFGRYLNSADAATIGLLPLMPRDKMEFMGNTALRGAVMALMDRKYCDMQIETARRMTYIDLSGEPGYMDAYTAALFLPHTDAGLFS
ncbi:MAG: ASKHA domain-containing protein, partial [Clostridia bacterium]|nr:ASKHA domain-containing protein [Clostridia bacterium]